MKKGKQKGGFWAQFQSSSNLLSNVYFRLFIFQVLVVSSVVFLLVFLIFNMFRNMEIRGIKTGFDFLGRTSGFGILFSLIDYSEASSYGRTYLVGLVNTIFVSLGGIVFATALGVTVGILRLSRNWLMRKLTTVYIETFRNLPILLQILFWNVVIKNILPEENWHISENILLYIQKTYVDIQGIFMSIPNDLLFIVLFAFCLLIGFLVFFSKWSKRRLEETGKTFPVFYTSLAIVAVFVASIFFLLNSMVTFENLVEGNFGLEDSAIFIPEVYLGRKGMFMPKLIPNDLFFIMLFAFCLLVGFLVLFAKWGSRRLEKTGKTFPVFYTSLTIIAIFAASVFFLFNSMFTFENPVQGRFGLEGGVALIPEIFVLVISLGVYTGTFIAEAVRSGIMAVDKGQKEAAAALGLKPGFILARIVMPQAMRVIIPPSINQYLNLTKNSSLAMAIGFPDLVAVFAGTTLNQVGQAIEIMLMTMFTYLALSTIVSLFLNWYNARVKLVER